MKQDIYEQEWIQMRQIAIYVLKKMKERREQYLADRKQIRRLTDELRRKRDMANYVELLRKEKSEAGKRFLLFILMYLFALFQTQKRDAKAVQELRRQLDFLLDSELSRQRTQGPSLSNIQKWPKAKNAGAIFDGIKPPV